MFQFVFYVANYLYCRFIYIYIDMYGNNVNVLKKKKKIGLLFDFFLYFCQPQRFNRELQL